MIERTPVLALDSGLMYYPLDRYWRETLDDLIIHFRFAHSLNATERCIPETYLLRVLRMLPEESYRIDGLERTSHHTKERRDATGLNELRYWRYLG